MNAAKLYDAGGDQLLGIVRVPDGPECGEDFCDFCGDCLGCFPDDCPGGHQWVVYEDLLPEFLAEHEGAFVEHKAAEAEGGER